MGVMTRSQTGHAVAVFLATFVATFVGVTVPDVTSASVDVSTWGTLGVSALAALLNAARATIIGIVPPGGPSR